MNDSPAVVTHHNKCEEDAECGGWDGEEVDRDDIANVVVQECPPSLRRWLAIPNPVFSHGRFGDRVAQKRELRLDPRDAQNRILAGHAANQLADF